MDKTVIYDKAKWHAESVAQAGLDKGQEFVHAGMYLGWLIEHELLDPEFADDFADEIHAFKERRITGPKLFQISDGSLIDEMLNDRGNEFSRFYFDFEKGQFVSDYQRAFGVGDGNDFFGVADTWENYEKLKRLIDRAYEEWGLNRSSKD